MGMFVTLLAGPGNVLVPNSSVWGVSMGKGWLLLLHLLQALPKKQHHTHCTQFSLLHFFLPTYLHIYLHFSLSPFLLAHASIHISHCLTETWTFTSCICSMRHQFSFSVYWHTQLQCGSLFVRKKTVFLPLFASCSFALLPKSHRFASVSPHMSISAYWWSTTHLAPISTLSLIMEILLTWVVHVPGLGGIWKL